MDRNGKRGVVYTIAPSPMAAPMMWVGTDDGLIHVTTNDGKTWQNVTPAALTPWSRVTMIDASHFDVNAAYASVDRHQLQDFEPYIYRTRDMGKTWQKITNGLPAGVYVHVVKEDPERRGLLVAGTERGAFVSLDDGDNWQPLQMNLPVTSVRDFEIYKNDLIVATHGRGFWVIDDISPLRQINATVLASDAHLFKPADAIVPAAGRRQRHAAPEGRTAGAESRPSARRSTTTSRRTPPGRCQSKCSTRAARSSRRSRIPRPSPAAADVEDGGGGGIPNTSALWRPAPEQFATTAGVHRVVWTPVAGGGGRGRGGGGRGGGANPLTGTFTARLSVGGQTYTQTFNVKEAPRPTS